jgi:hypothetical protein
VAVAVAVSKAAVAAAVLAAAAAVSVVAARARAEATTDAMREAAEAAVVRLPDGQEERWAMVAAGTVMAEDLMLRRPPRGMA